MNLSNYLSVDKELFTGTLVKVNTNNTINYIKTKSIIIFNMILYNIFNYNYIILIIRFVIII